MKNVYGHTVVLVALMAMSTIGAEPSTGEKYVSYRTIDKGQLELTFDTAEFARQGWSVAQDVVLPMSVSSANALSVMTLNGEFLKAGKTRNARNIAKPRWMGRASRLENTPNPVENGNGEAIHT